MADRGQITGAILDGPLALDNAISPEAAAIKKIKSEVAGRANVLIVPDLEAGNMLAKSLTFLADADAAGIVLGARVPIILTSRADSVLTRLASCAIASLIVEARAAAARTDRGAFHPAELRGQGSRRQQARGESVARRHATGSRRRARPPRRVPARRVRGT
jgi:hypothetical protein